MPTVHLLGKVLPAKFQISIDQKSVAKLDNADTGLIAHSIRVQIKDSLIDVECDLNRYTQRDLYTVAMWAHDMSAVWVNLIAFKTGWGMTTVIDTIVDQHGSHGPIYRTNDDLQPLCTSFSLTSWLDEAHKIAGGTVALFTALNDLIVANTNLGATAAPINCARAIDGLKHLIASPSSTETKKWEEFRAALRLDKTYIQIISDHSTAPRHGQFSRIAGSDRLEIIKRSWVIMNRYLEYRKGGSKPLPLTDFPLLSG
jgi:hypothetical protein